MNRRVFMSALTGGLLAAPLAAEAQSSAGIARIGILTLAAAATGPPYDQFREALRTLGYVEGTNIALEFRLAGGKVELLPELAADLARLKVEVIVTDGGVPSVRAAMNATRTIPIVMATGPDPVASGLAASLARPGGNLTGLTLNYADLAGKRLQLLKEVVPGVTRIAVLWDPTVLIQFRATEAAARPLGLQLQSLPVRGPADLDGVFEAARRGRAGALLQLASRVLFDNRSAIVNRALKYHLPGLFETEFAEAGGLMSYGPSVPDNFRRAAVYVDKILRGAKPADLPFEEPSVFRLVINLKTAKALGLTIPSSLLARADEVIQ